MYLNNLKAPKELIARLDKMTVPQLRARRDELVAETKGSMDAKFVHAALVETIAIIERLPMTLNMEAAASAAYEPDVADLEDDYADLKRTQMDALDIAIQ